MKHASRSRTVWAAGLTGALGVATAVDPSGGVGGAVAYLLQFALGIALSHGTEVNRPEVDLGQLINAGTIIAGTVWTWIERTRATQLLKWK